MRKAYQSLWNSPCESNIVWQEYLQIANWTFLCRSILFLLSFSDAIFASIVQRLMGRWIKSISLKSRRRTQGLKQRASATHTYMPIGIACIVLLFGLQIIFPSVSRSPGTASHWESLTLVKAGTHGKLQCSAGRRRSRQSECLDSDVLSFHVLSQWSKILYTNAQNTGCF